MEHVMMPSLPQLADDVIEAAIRAHESRIVAVAAQIVFQLYSTLLIPPDIAVEGDLCVTVIMRERSTGLLRGSAKFSLPIPGPAEADFLKTKDDTDPMTPDTLCTT